MVKGWCVRDVFWLVYFLIRKKRHFALPFPVQSDNSPMACFFLFRKIQNFFLNFSERQNPVRKKNRFLAKKKKTREKIMPSISSANFFVIFFFSLSSACDVFNSLPANASPPEKKTISYVIETKNRYWLSSLSLWKFNLSHFFFFSTSLFFSLFFFLLSTRPV